MQEDYSINERKLQVVKFDKLIRIPNNAVVSVERQGRNYMQVSYVARKYKATVRRLSRDKYLCVSTGEVKEYSKRCTDKSQLDYGSLARTFKRLRGLIRHNFTCEGSNQLFVTLTYEDNMRNANRLFKDFKAFYMRLKRAYKQHDFAYISVAEPQGRGAWHLHVMLKSLNMSVLYIDNKHMTRLWGHGATYTERLKSDDVGSYYVSYFTDLVGENKNGGNDKKRKKHARLKYYPAGFKLYRVSHGIERPTKENIRYSDVVSDDEFKRTYATSYGLVEVEDFKVKEVVNVIHNETYKRQ